MGTSKAEGTTADAAAISLGWTHAGASRRLQRETGALEIKPQSRTPPRQHLRSWCLVDTAAGPAMARDAAGASGPAGVVLGLPFRVHLWKSSCSWSCSLYQRWRHGACSSITKPDIHKPSCAPRSWLQRGKQGVVQSGREGLQRKGTPELSISSQDHHNNSLWKMRCGVSCWLQGAIELSGCGHWLSLPVQGACQTIWEEHLLPSSPAATAKGVQRRNQAKGCWAQQ